MAVRHAWSVIAERAFREEVTGQLSLTLVEGITLRGDFPEPIPDQAVVPAQLHIESAWYASSLDDSDRVARGRVRLQSGDRPIGQMEFDAVVPHGALVARTKLGFPALPLRDGILFFIIERRDGDTWHEVSRLPLLLTVERMSKEQVQRELRGQPPG